MQVVDTRAVAPEAADPVMDSMTSRTWTARSADALGFPPERRALAISRTPMPRPSALPSAGISAQSVSVGIFSHSSGATLLRVLLTQEHGPIESVRIGQADHRFSALHLQLAEGSRGIEAEGGRADRAGGELQQRGDLRVDGNVECLPGARAAADFALVLGSAAEARDGLYRTEHLDERSDVIWAHVKQWTPSLLEKELWAWMPRIRTGIAERGSG